MYTWNIYEAVCVFKNINKNTLRVSAQTHTHRHGMLGGVCKQPPHEKPSSDDDAFRRQTHANCLSMKSIYINRLAMYISAYRQHHCLCLMQNLKRRRQEGKTASLSLTLAYKHKLFNDEINKPWNSLKFDTKSGVSRALAVPTRWKNKKAAHIYYLVSSVSTPIWCFVESVNFLWRSFLKIGELPRGTLIFINWLHFHAFRFLPQLFALPSTRARKWFQSSDALINYFHEKLEIFNLALKGGKGNRCIMWLSPDAIKEQTFHSSERALREY